MFHKRGKLLLGLSIIGAIIWSGCSKKNTSTESNLEKPQQSTKQIATQKEENRIQPVYAKIVMKIGKVKVYKAKSGKMEPAFVGLKLEEADKLIVGKNSQAVIKTDTGSIIKLKENTEFSLNTLRKVDGKEQNSFAMKIGKAILKPRKLKKGESFEVQTPSAVAGVRGTVFSVETTKSKDTKVAVYKGKVVLKNRIPEDIAQKDKEIAEKLSKILEKEVVIAENEKVEVKKSDIEKVVKKVEEAKAKKGEKELSLEDIETIVKSEKIQPIKKAKIEEKEKKEFESFKQEVAQKLNLVPLDAFEEPQPTEETAKTDETVKEETKTKPVAKQEEEVQPIAMNLERVKINGISAISFGYGDEIYVITKNGKIMSFNQKGEKIYEKDFSEKPSTTPLIEEGILFIGFGEKLYGISLDNKKVVWKTEIDDLDEGAYITYYNGDIYLSLKEGKVVKVSDTGKVIWEYSTKGNLYSQTAFGEVTTIVKAKSIEQATYGQPKMANIVCDENMKCKITRMVVFQTDSKGYIYAINLQTGEKIWRKRYSGINPHIKPYAYQNTVYIVKAGDIISISTQNGKILSKKHISNQKIVDIIGYKTYILATNTSNKLYKYDIAENKVQTLSSFAEKVSEIKLYKGKIIVSTKNTIYAISLTGEILWQHKSNTDIDALSNIRANSIVFSDITGRLHSVIMNTI